MKTPTVKLTGTIKKVLPETRYMIYCSRINADVLCYLTGKLKRGHGKPDIGDEVEFEVDESDVKRGRIVKFLK